MNWGQKVRQIRQKIAATLLIAVAAASACFAQDAKVENTEKTEPKFFKLYFAMKEFEGGKLANSRTYYMLASTDSGTNSLRSGEKLPVASGVGNTWQVYDVGTNVDCRRVRPFGNELALDVTVEASGIPQESSGTTSQPIVRNYRWSSGVIIPLNKPTVIFSSDHVSGKGQIQVELTATPVL
jgi:hypothetical protein